MTTPAPHRHLSRRIGAVATGTVLLLTGVSLSSASPSTASPAPVGDVSNSTECQPANAHRVRRGGSAVDDPNTLTSAQVTASANRLSARARALPNVIRSKIIRPTSTINIGVYVHVIQKTDGTGGISDARIAQQIAVLNTAYAGSRFSFTLRGTNSRNNTSWYNWPDPDVNPSIEAAAKGALHQGTVADLNIYLAGNLGGGTGLLGYATFPGGSLTLDGVVALTSSLPGGPVTTPANPYAAGDTMTHEVGHWLGLYHTFQDGCSFSNDMVKDTPAQFDGQNKLGCNENDDTCVLPGKDPVHNFMSYGNDACLDNFTSGQGIRMRQSWYAYRASGVRT